MLGGGGGGGGGEPGLEVARWVPEPRATAGVGGA